MNFKITFEADERYYKEAFQDIIASKKLKKWEPIFACLMIVFGIVFYFLDKNNVLSIFPFVFSGIGVYELFKSFYGKRKWLNDRLDSRASNQLMELEFDEEVIKHTGPFSKGEIKWTGLKTIKKTPNGIVLKPDTGIVIYLPDARFNNREEIDFILSKQNLN